MSITRLNHAVLYVRDAARTSSFYQDLLGFSVVADEGDGQAVFLRAPGSENHHDLGLFTIGLFHLAWEVTTPQELADLRTRLAAAGALVGTSDHGVSKSLYAADPDGIELEVMWAVPPEEWGKAEHQGVVAPLDPEAELASRSRDAPEPCVEGGGAQTRRRVR